MAVMGIALNFAALVLVVGISWVGMVWLASFFHKGETSDHDSAIEDN